MIRNTLSRLALAFLVAVVIATVWGAIVQTQFNLGHLAAIGTDITAGVRIQTTVSDIFSGFSPTYGVYVVLPSLLVAFLIAALAARHLPGPILLWFTVAGFVAILLGNPVVNYLSPVALLVGATRDVACLLLMSLGGALAGALFADMRPVPTRRIPYTTQRRAAVQT